MIQSWAVIQFPGSNSDLDAFHVFERLPGVRPVMHWHDEKIEPGQYQVILVPGGFSFGDYLRAGAIAKLSNAVASLPEAVTAGAHAIGVCNGFQILLESRLLPGILQANKNMKFVSRFVDCEVKTEAFPWFGYEALGKVLRLPIAHGYGNYQFSNVDRSDLVPVIRYRENPNGSKDDIAGVYRKMGKGSVFGLMPHPERASLVDQSRPDGSIFWKNALKNLSQ